MLLEENIYESCTYMYKATPTIFMYVYQGSEAVGSVLGAKAPPQFFNFFAHNLYIKYMYVY